MKRDMDLVREILLAVEGGDEGDGHWIDINLEGVEQKELIQHMIWMDEAGLVIGNNTSSSDGPDYHVRRLTWFGCDFLDAVRDPAIWSKTKDGAKKAGAASIEFIWEIAKTYGKQAIKERLGIDVG